MILKMERGVVAELVALYLSVVQDFRMNLGTIIQFFGEMLNSDLVAHLTINDL
jgi:hypothetical protein